MVVSNTYAVKSVNKDLKLPHDYQYSDGKPNEVVKPKVLWDDIPPSHPKPIVESNLRLGSLVGKTGSFARNIANRMWKKMMGLGIVEPVDDFRDDNAPSNPELLEHLTDEVLRLNFDIRELVRIIAYSQTFTTPSRSTKISSTEPFRFQGRSSAGMTAEQFVDSLLTLVAYNHWAYQRPTAERFGEGYRHRLDEGQCRMAEQVTTKFDTSYAPGSTTARFKNFAASKANYWFAPARFRLRFHSAIFSSVWPE